MEATHDIATRLLSGVDPARVSRLVAAGALKLSGAEVARSGSTAWRLASTQRRVREPDILTDRDRSARDLHDHVQRLFAIGLALQGTIPGTQSPEGRQRLSDSVDDPQEVIHEIRTATFDLHGGSAGTTRLRQRLDEAMAQLAGSDVRATVQIVGPLSVIESTSADHAEAAVREAARNAVRHGGATEMTVLVTVDDDLSSSRRQRLRDRR